MMIGVRAFHHTPRTFCGAAALIGLVGAASPSFAQQVEEIIVTAERRAENIQDVPISVTTMSGGSLTSLFDSGQDVRALAGKVPSLYAESSNGRVAPRFYIRGLGNTDFDLAASQPVSIIMDDVVMENVVLKSFPLFDLEGVEISRGPQGTLFGRNTTAGIVKFTSRKPTNEWEANAAISYGTYNTLNVEAGFGGPIVPGKLAVRFSGLIQNRSDYIDNYDGVTYTDDAMGGYRERAGRAQILLTPNDDLSILVNVHGRSLNGTAAIFRANILGPGNNKLNGNYDPDLTFFDQGGFNPQKYNGIGESIKIEYKLPSMVLTSITANETVQGTSRGDIDGGNLIFGPGFIPFPSDTQDGLDHLGQFTQELHLASDTDGKLFWQIGGFYFDSDFRITTVGPSGFPPPTEVRHKNKAGAVFGQASYAFTEAFTFTAGLRYTKDNKNLFSPGIDKISLSADNLSWDASGIYKLTPDLSVYVRAATGFRAPSIQGRDIAFFNPASFARSETVKSIEGGVKSQLFDNKLRLNGDVFYYTVNNMQLSAIGGGANLVRLINADSGEAFGFEFDSEAHITEHFVITAGASYTHTEIKDTALTTGVCAQCTVLDPRDLLGNALLDGNPFPQAPKWIATLTARYGIPLGPGEIFIYTDWSYQGYTNFFLYESAEYYSKGNFEGGLKIGYATEAYEAAAFVRNITNEANVQGGIDFNNLTAFVSDPRVIGVSLSAKFH